MQIEKSLKLYKYLKGGCYTGTHVPMFVPRLGLIKPGQTYVCPKLWAFSITITLWLILHFLENRRLVCPKLAAGFFRTFCLLSLSVGFFNGPGRTYLATLQCLSWLLEDQICLLAFSTEFERHMLQWWVSRNVALGLSISLFQIVQDSFVQKLACSNRLLLLHVSKVGLFLNLCFHLYPKFGLF